MTIEKQNFSTELRALASLASTGFLQRTGAETYAFVADPLPVANGGTASASASAARTALGLAIGTDVQAWDTQLDTLAALTAGRITLLSDISGLAVTDSNFIVGNGTTWVAESGATVRTSLGLGTIATQAASAVAITGGAVDGATVGSTTAAAGKFTTLSTSGAFVAGATALTGDPGPHGAVTGTSGAYAWAVENSHATAPNGLFVKYANAAPDNNTQRFINCVDNAEVRAIVYSDGDVQNHDNSYGAISDERLKQAIVDARSQWADVKALRVRNYRFKSDGANGKPHIGLISQEVMPISPGLVLEDGQTGFYGVQYSVLYMKAFKALQEAMARIEALETRVAALGG